VSSNAILIVNILVFYIGLLVVNIVVAGQKHVNYRVFVILIAVILPPIVYLYLLATPNRSRSSGDRGVNNE
jgi:hypothetical protein